jgi:adenylate kinase
MNGMQGLPPVIYVLMGCPGSGKGTFSQVIKNEGYDHLSTGDVIREEVKNETEFGIKYKEVILNHVGGGIPFEEIQKLVEQRLEKAVEQQRGIILDGYPKTVQQCKLLDAFVERKELKGRVVFVLLNVNEEEAINRIQFRQTCEKCNKIFNLKFFPSKILDECDDCHSVLTKRIDDNMENTNKRVYEFKNKMSSVLKYYNTTNRLKEIDVNFSAEMSVGKFLQFHSLQNLNIRLVE